MVKIKKIELKIRIYFRKFWILTLISYILYLDLAGAHQQSQYWIKILILIQIISKRLGEIWIINFKDDVSKDTLLECIVHTDWFKIQILINLGNRTKEK